jgi:hypothetical protein
MSRPPHPPWCNYPKNLRWRIQVMNFIIMQFSSRSVFITFRSKYLSQHSFLKISESVFLPKIKRPSSAVMLHKLQNYNFVYFNLQRRVDKRFLTE